MSEPSMKLSNGNQMPRLGFRPRGIIAEAATGLVGGEITTGCRLIATAIKFGNERQVGDANDATPVPRSQRFAPFQNQIERIAWEISSTPAITPIEVSQFSHCLEQHRFHTANNIFTECRSPRRPIRCLKREVVLATAKEHKRTPAQVELRFMFDQLPTDTARRRGPRRPTSNFSVGAFEPDVSDFDQLLAFDVIIAGKPSPVREVAE